MINDQLSGHGPGDIRTQILFDQGPYAKRNLTSKLTVKQLASAAR